MARTYNVDATTIGRLAASSPFEHGAVACETRQTLATNLAFDEHRDALLERARKDSGYAVSKPVAMKSLLPLHTLLPPISFTGIVEPKTFGPS